MVLISMLSSRFIYRRCFHSLILRKKKVQLLNIYACLFISCLNYFSLKCETIENIQFFFLSFFYSNHIDTVLLSINILLIIHAYSCSLYCTLIIHAYDIIITTSYDNSFRVKYPFYITYIIIQMYFSIFHLFYHHSKKITKHFSIFSQPLILFFQCINIYYEHENRLRRILFI